MREVINRTFTTEESIIAINQPRSFEEICKNIMDTKDLNHENSVGITPLMIAENGRVEMLEKPLTEMTEEELVELNLLITAAEKRLSLQDPSSVTHIEESALSNDYRI